MSAPEISHGRGGAGNINPDDTKYVDGEIVREGEVGSHHDGAFSTGRGGGGNIGDAGRVPGPRKDTDKVPQAATRPSMDDVDHHVGRGGAANVHLSPEHEKRKQAERAETSVADRLKSKIFGMFKK